MRTLFLIRGLPSSGKSTLAWDVNYRNCLHFEADSYFYVDGEYKFDPKKLTDAHKNCQREVEEAIRRIIKCERGANRTKSDWSVCVSNTFTQRWEMEPYISMAEKFSWRLVVIDLFDGGCDDKTLFDRNKHDVPLESFARMRERYEHDWRAGNPIPPWEREPKE